MNGGQKFIGIEIGGSKLQLMMGNAGENIEKHERYEINAAEGASGIQNKILECFDKWSVTDDPDIQSIGVGFGGPVNWKTGNIEVSYHVPGWSGFNLKTWLETVTTKPVIIDNDANVAALGEKNHGAGKGYERVFYMTVGSGVGAGMIVDSDIYHGDVPGELEIGHVRLDKQGTILQDVCSGWAVNEKVRSHIIKNPSCLLSQLSMCHKGPDAALLKPALESQDPAAREIMNEVADNIAFALSHVVHLFHPQIIIIGGGLSLLGSHLSLPIASALPNYLMDAFLPPPALILSALGENVVPIGALTLAKMTLNSN